MTGAATRRALLGAALAAAAPLLVGHAPYRQWHVLRRRRLVLVVNGADGTAVRLGEAAAATLTTALPESRAMLATASSTADVVALLRSGQLDVALLPADEAFEAFTGSAAYGGWPVPLAALAQLDSVLLHLVVRADRPLGRLSDLGGRVVGVGMAHRGEVLLARVLSAAGVAVARTVPLPVAEAAAAFREGRVDAFAWLDAPPSDAVRRLAAGLPSGVRLLGEDGSLTRLAERHGQVYRAATIPAGTYAGGAADVRVAALPYLVVCRSGLADAAAHDVAEALGAAVPDGRPLPAHPALAHDTSATPASASAPPATAADPGTSPSQSHSIRIETGGTR